MTCRERASYSVDQAVYGDCAGSDEETKRHEPILCGNAIERGREGPRCGVGVVRLNGGTAPGGVAIAVDEDVAVLGHDRVHDGVAHEATEDCAVDLGEEHGPRRDLDWG
jgi:hypothetical protein